MDTLHGSRSTLHLVAVHVVARARIEATGRFSLRITPGGFGTPEVGPDARRVRVSGTHLVVESDAPGEPRARSMSIGGASLTELATFAGLDLDEPIEVGHDTPPVGDTGARFELDAQGAGDVSEWFGTVAAVLDRTLAELPFASNPTLPRLWPEHFDVAIEAQANAERRVNLGGSPGDGFSDEPYLYIGPWTAHRPGDAAFWNAPFGAFRTRSALAEDPSGIVAAGAAFLLDGYRRLV